MNTKIEKLGMMSILCKTQTLLTVQMLCTTLGLSKIINNTKSSQKIQHS